MNETKTTPQQGETAGAVYAELPRPGSPEASAMIDSVLAEYSYPSNPKNAARAGFEAARRMLAAPHAAAASGAPNDVPMSPIGLWRVTEADGQTHVVHKHSIASELAGDKQYPCKVEPLQAMSEGAPAAAAPAAVSAPSGFVLIDPEDFRDIIRDIGQHIDQGVASERKGAAERPGYGTGMCVHIANQMAKMSRLIAAAPQAPSVGDALAPLRAWWGLLEAQWELCEETPADDVIILHFMGSGASTAVTAGQLRAALSNTASPQAPAGEGGAS